MVIQESSNPAFVNALRSEAGFLVVTHTDNPTYYTEALAMRIKDYCDNQGILLYRLQENEQIILKV